MASLNSNPVHKLYMSVIEDVINNVRELDEGPEEHVLKELKTLWENKLIQSKAVEGFHTETPGWETKQPRAMDGFTERLPSWDNKHLMQPKGGFFNTEMQAALHATRHQQMRRFQHFAQPATAAQTQQQGLLPPPQQQAPQWYTHSYPQVPPHPQLINNQGQFVQMMRGPKGDFYVQHQQQPFLLHQQQPMLLQKPMQPGGMQAHVVQQQLLSPLQGGLPQQPGVMVQHPPYVFVPRKQVMMQATTMTPQTGSTAASWAQQVSGQTAAAWAHGAAAAPQASGQTAAAPQVSGQTAAAWAHVAAASQASGLSTAEWAKGAASPQAPRQPQAQQPPVLLQVDGTGDTSSSGEDEDEEEDVKCEVEKENEDGQIEEEPLNSGDDESGGEDKGDEFDADYVVVCQYEKKVQRIKNRWKFQLKDGIMNLNGRDYIFSKAIGEAEW